MRHKEQYVHQEGQKTKEHGRQDQDEQAEQVSSGVGRRMKVGSYGQAQDDEVEECCDRVYNKQGRERMPGAGRQVEVAVAVRSKGLVYYAVRGARAYGDESYPYSTLFS